jgi:hypothetical protein
MPDGNNFRYLDPDRFSDKLCHVDPGLLTDEWPQRSILIFHGINSSVKGWHDEATTVAESMAEKMREVGITWTPILCLWPGLSGTDAIQFHRARQNAVRAARQFYAPFVRNLLARGKEVAFLGHSAGCWLTWQIIRALWVPLVNRRCVSAVVWMNAAIRASEMDPRNDLMLHSEPPPVLRWLNFHSHEDSALRLMQLDPIDEAGGWKRWAKDLLRLKRHPTSERIVGMHGLDLPGVENVDLTEIIHERHSDARHWDGTWKRSREVLG